MPNTMDFDQEFEDYLVELMGGPPTTKPTWHVALSTGTKESFKVHYLKQKKPTFEEFVTGHVGPVSGYTNNPTLNTWEKYFTATNPTNLVGWKSRYEKEVLNKEPSPATKPPAPEPTPAVRFINRKKNESRIIDNKIIFKVSGMGEV